MQGLKALQLRMNQPHLDVLGVFNPDGSLADSDADLHSRDMDEIKDAAEQWASR